MAKGQTTSLFKERPKISRPNVHAKTKTSKNKTSKNYRKKYRGQGK
jgi:hypothetical protein